MNSSNEDVGYAPTRSYARSGQEQTNTPHAYRDYLDSEAPRTDWVFRVVMIVIAALVAFLGYSGYQYNTFSAPASQSEKVRT